MSSSLKWGSVGEVLPSRDSTRIAKHTFDVAKIRTIFESCKKFDIYFQFLPFLPQKFVRVDKIHYLCRLETKSHKGNTSR